MEADAQLEDFYLLQISQLLQEVGDEGRDVIYTEFCWNSPKMLQIVMIIITVHLSV